ncbi:MAG TPA: alpha/beta hydrolase [Acidimicrobiia bacterium]|nr:alpha/beta hydrolase [Acidimicrobiia bacterium]
MSDRQDHAILHAYGPDPDQYGELTVPAGERRPGVVIVIHGGFWRTAFDASGGRPLCVDLARRGWIAWNIEYRRVGGGGGWPTTFQDVAEAIDLLADLDLDTSAVVAVGHSAGGHLAAWAAGRDRLPASAPGASARVRVSAVVAQAGVLDLRTAATSGVGGTATVDLLGGTPQAVPQRYALTDPILQVPLAVPVVCVHSRADDTVPFRQSETYVAAGRAVGADVELVEVEGDHMTHRDPSSAAWAAVVDALSRLMPS